MAIPNNQTDKCRGGVSPPVIMSLKLLNSIFPLVAQLDNAADSDSEERGFKSLRAGQQPQPHPLGWGCAYYSALQNKGFEYGNLIYRGKCVKFYGRYIKDNKRIISYYIYEVFNCESK